MKPKNVMLLGFVNKAIEYLENHLDEQPNTAILELKSLDLASLKDELSKNLELSLGSMQSTMLALLTAGGDAFDKFVDIHYGKETLVNQIDRIFDVDFDNNEDSQEGLARLLSFYNLEDNFEVADQEIDDDQYRKDEEDDLLKQIRSNASKTQEEELVANELPTDHTDNHELDSIFLEIVANEEKNGKKSYEADNPQRLADEIINQNNNEEIISDKINVEENLVEEIEKTDDFLSKIIENPAIDVDDTSLAVEEEPAEEDEYVSSLIEDLRKQMLEDENKKKQIKEEMSAIYKRIHDIFPYLPESFVIAAYDMKDYLASKYPLGIQIIVLHRLSFKSIENLRQFVEICLNHDYQINADESQLIVDVFRQQENTQGRILNEIFEIANQAYLLDGVYEGYRIIINNEGEVTND